MASRNALKQYLSDSFYHLYNRGVEKRNIFLDEQDFNVFVSYIRNYLEPKDRVFLEGIIHSPVADYHEKDVARRELVLNNFSDEIELHCFALLPNHFHFLIKQKSENAIDKFINSLGTRYSMYFNRKYKRVGKLYQGVYKASLVETDEQFLHLSRYIHLNPFNWLNFPVDRWSEVKLPSSLGDYLSSHGRPWIKTKTILDYFTNNNGKETYYDFIKNYSDPEIIVPVSLDYEEE